MGGRFCWSIARCVSISRRQFLAFAGAGDLAAIALADEASPIGKALAGIDETNAVLKQRGAAILKNPHVQHRLTAAESVSSGENLSAQAYRMITAEQFRECFSLACSNAIILEVAEQLNGYSGKRTGRSQRGF